MSYQDHSGGYPPPRDQPESQYPPPPGEEDDRIRAYHQRGPSTSGSVTLPSISPYDPQYAQPPNGYPPDPRAYQQDVYRHQAGPYRDDRGGYQQDYGRGGPQHMAFSQSAPRQRTAIACRYCRRRKVSANYMFLESTKIAPFRSFRTIKPHAGNSRRFTIPRNLRRLHKETMLTV
jgi:hypothetical protein